MRHNRSTIVHTSNAHVLCGIVELYPKYPIKRPSMNWFLIANKFVRIISRTDLGTSTSSKPIFHECQIQHCFL